MNKPLFFDDVVIKSGRPEAIRIEAEKMVRARALGLESGLFRVPELLDVDEKAGRMTIERIAGLQGIRRARLPREDLWSLMGRVGAALAHVHDELRLPTEMTIPLPKELDGPRSAAYLHGDFSGENVCVTADDPPSLVLLDWQVSPRCGNVATYGTRYFDVAWFVCNLFRKPIYRYLGAPSAYTAASVFVASYLSNAKAEVNQHDFREYHEKFYNHRIATQERKMLFPKRVLLAPGLLYWRKFVVGR